ncbi:hypothetical protein HRR83_007644 [Exophiala dermatitidis]|uniref:Uncharacterized protein n=1 Tax=Exophiala dermatitidis TaxID=5970 RepID=A0AAN6EP28_EXODE|nr:hypothetical protein HRR74_007119 [Exophiala dermatitidis]KAJ4521782.1 hypothetical protein HRR73_002980 [Exophiala dermatitidis]KAJ4539476.1 hypothetical protein HRR77_006360 [Exophiala dermatitidis]KAJ4548445.1 hypothetical protein HRR76_001044 [Exophiala dermatitidis]KAJ4562898.1 hypothetical protein HRR79_006494 [Exophiala dermatitidis]
MLTQDRAPGSPWRKKAATSAHNIAPLIPESIWKRRVLGCNDLRVALLQHSHFGQEETMDGYAPSNKAASARVWSKGHPNHDSLSTTNPVDDDAFESPAYCVHIARGRFPWYCS